MISWSVGVVWVGCTLDWLVSIGYPSGPWGLFEWFVHLTGQFP